MIQHSDSQCLPTKTNSKIALLEDDEFVAEVALQVLKSMQCECHYFVTIADITTALSRQTFDLLLLDWSLPDGNAEQVNKLVRNDLGLSTPILIESVNNDEQQIVDALLLGANDYVTKPLRVYELQARLAVLLRNSQRKIPNITRHGDYQFDNSNKQLYLNGEVIKLSSLEYQLCHYFFNHLNELISREQLLKDVWAQYPMLVTRKVVAGGSHLRKKLILEQQHGLQIRSLRGYGYRMESSL